LREKDMVHEVVHTDVLVVGGGAAALRAAVEASRVGSQVSIACDRSIGRSGNTVVAGGGFSIDPEGSEESKRSFFEDTLQGGENINDEHLVRILIDESTQKVIDLEEIGVLFLKRDREFIKRRPPEHSIYRSIVIDWENYPIPARGLAISLPLRKKCQKLGISFLEKCPIIKLISRANKVVGAIAVDIAKNKFLFIQAKATILATGGCGQLFFQTNNAPGIIGAGLILALNAGAVLQDLEFIQFYPNTALKPVKIGISSTLLGEGAVFRNRLGQTFMSRYGQASEDKSTRDKIARACYWEIQKGLGVENGVYLDCTGVSEGILGSRYGPLVHFLREKGLDLRNQWALVSPTVHFCMGGIHIDEYGFTGVEGLYAVGEATVGVHGANRIAGNALTETQVFGARAGKAAAEYARKESRFSVSKWEKVEELTRIAKGRCYSDFPAVKQSIQQIMWRYGSIVRNATSLRIGEDAILQKQEHINQLKTRTLKQLVYFQELSSMCELALLILHSAILREESRGSHYRDDFPKRNDQKWLGNIIVSKKEGKPIFNYVSKNLTMRDR
jgi:succinate dehydrogenase/fumarate reductase flavoprotein subunit